MAGAELIDDVVLGPTGRKIGFLARGPKNGHTVVHLHGAPGSRREQHLVFPDEVLARFGVRAVSVDRPGYGNTDPLPAGRPERAQDVLAVADALGIDRFALVGVSSGGTNALTLAAVAPRRVDRVVLLSAQMPYDDDEAITGLQPGQAFGLPFLRGGRSELIEQYFVDVREAILADPIGGFEEATQTLSRREQTWYSQPWVRDAFVADMQEALRVSPEGYMDDNLISVHAFEADVSAVVCPVRAVHGTADDWEPLTNLRRILAQLPEAQIFLLDGLNHFGGIMYPDLAASLCLKSLTA